MMKRLSGGLKIIYSVPKQSFLTSTSPDFSGFTTLGVPGENQCEWFWPKKIENLIIYVVALYLQSFCRGCQFSWRADQSVACSRELPQKSCSSLAVINTQSLLVSMRLNLTSKISPFIHWPILFFLLQIQIQIQPKQFWDHQCLIC